MYCPNCGGAVSNQAKYCISCGTALTNVPGHTTQPIPPEKKGHTAMNAPQPTPPGLTRPVPPGTQHPAPTGTQQPLPLFGFSPRINDPAFARYIRHSYLWPLIFALILALIAAIGFYIAGERGVDGMDNPESLYYGFGVGGMFITIALFQVMKQKRSKTWDGTVWDKQVKKKTKRHKYEDGSVSYFDYLEYTVKIAGDNGKKHVLRYENNNTRYNYFQVGDRLRHHGKLRTFEKYDKRSDKIIFCNACRTLCDINDDYCFRCKCPLLK